MDSSPDEALPVVYFIQTRLYLNEFFFDTSNELERGGQGWRRVGLKPRLPIGERKREEKIRNYKLVNSRKAFFVINGERGGTSYFIANYGKRITRNSFATERVAQRCIINKR